MIEIVGVKRVWICLHPINLLFFGRNMLRPYDKYNDYPAMLLTTTGKLFTSIISPDAAS